MAHYFADDRVVKGLSGQYPFSTYLFVDIMVYNPELTVNPDGCIYITTWPHDITTPNASGDQPSTIYEPDLLDTVSPPARTGLVTQEIQRFQIAQGLSANWVNAGFDFIRLLGADYHNSTIYFRAIMVPHDGLDETLIMDEPIIRTEGLLKGITRSVKDNTVTVEFSNSFGKLNQLNELRTTPGSLKRRDKEDTSFDRAHLDVNKKVLDWGIKS